jgi:hypothetical protein
MCSVHYKLKWMFAGMEYVKTWRYQKKVVVHVRCDGEDAHLLFHFHQFGILALETIINKYTWEAPKTSSNRGARGYYNKEFLAYHHPNVMYAIHLGDEDGNEVVMVLVARDRHVDIACIQEFNPDVPDLVEEFPVWEAFIEEYVMTLVHHAANHPSKRQVTVYEFLVNPATNGLYGKWNACEFLSHLKVPPLDPAWWYMSQPAFRRLMYQWQAWQIAIVGDKSFTMDDPDRKRIFTR